jgi:hypothetical protein
MTATGNPKAFNLVLPITSPTPHIYRFYLIENEGTSDESIYPLYQGTTNAFTIATVATNLNPTIALGVITITNGVATPANNPISVNTGVSSAGENKLVPEILLSGTPPTGPLSDLVNNGLEYLKNGSIFKAKAYFKAAVAIADTSNDGDTARFFYAVTRVAGVNLYSDGNSADLNSVGDFLDNAGCSSGGRGFGNSTMTCPEILPVATPTGSQMQTFAYNVIRPELEAALVNLNAVSISFTKTWTTPFDLTTPYKSDYADVLVYKAAIKGALAAINTQYAYNLGANIATEVNNKTNTVQAFLSSNTDFLKLASGYLTYLAAAKTYLSNAADDLSAAIDIINVSGRNTATYLINLQSVSPADISKAKSELALAKSSLTSQQTVYNNDTPSDTTDDYIINISNFSAASNLRSLLPPFTGNNVSGSFPDKTMGGVIVQFGSNVDGINADTKLPHGIPDILK